jgi:hypothetical protein
MRQGRGYTTAARSWFPAALGNQWNWLMEGDDNARSGMMVERLFCDGCVEGCF